MRATYASKLDHNQDAGMVEKWAGRVVRTKVRVVVSAEVSLASAKRKAAGLLPWTVPHENDRLLSGQQMFQHPGRVAVRWPIAHS